MTYNPKTHLLRPLEPGEIIEEGDLRIDFAECRIQETHHWITGTVFDIAIHTQHFRPVPITTGWRPRSEVNLIKPSDVVVWKSGHLHNTFQDGYIPSPAWSHFLIIPPCDLPPPDPERERFEKWWATLSVPTALNYETAWMVWQAAARKEAV